MSWDANSRMKWSVLGGNSYPQGRKGRFKPRSVIPRDKIKYIYGKKKR